MSYYAVFLPEEIGLQMACTSAISFPTTPQWLGHQVEVVLCPLSRRVARMLRISLSLALIGGIAGRRFAIQSRTDLLSLSIGLSLVTLLS